MSNFGDRLRSLREEREKTQEDIAKLLGVSRGAISKYEKSEREPDIKVINELTNYFDVTTDYLFGRTSIKTKPDYIANNIKLIMNGLTLDELIISIKNEIGITIEKSDMEAYIKGSVAPALGTLQALADYANVRIDFFYKYNTLEDLEKEKNINQKSTSDDSEWDKINKLLKNRIFIRLASKIIENDLDIEMVEKLVENAILIKRNSKNPQK